MKFLYGKMNRLCILLILLCFTITSVFAEESRIEFILESDNCGGTLVQATAGEATLCASADGINREKIRWDTDPAISAPRMQGKKLAAGWNVRGYWLIEFSGENLSNMTFAADMFSSGKAPKSFEMYYSINGMDFIKADNSEVALSKKSQTVYDNFSLPQTLNNSSKIYIKLMINSSKAVNGSDITGVRDGSTYINNIIINGSGNVKPDDKKEEQNEKSYYNTKENLIIQRIGQTTGKYKFSVKIPQN